MKKALFIRMDRIGDLIFSLPCDRLVQTTHEVVWLIPENLDFICQSAKPQRSFKTLSKKPSFENFKKLFMIIKRIKPDAVIIFHAPWWVYLAAFLAGVKIRGGVLSQWHSWLFLNKALRQKRSQCEFHEMEYNFQLTEFVFDLKSDKKQWQPLELKSSDFTNVPFNLPGNYFVVHPGMGGSALNWPGSHYIELIKRLAKKATVIITGTVSDEPYLKPIKEALKENPKIIWTNGKLKPHELLKLLKNSIVNIAPSTGILHLSASLGVASIGLYSPVKVHGSDRWGPMGKKTTTLTPQVDCPARFKCLGEQCPHYFCMKTLSVDQVAKQALIHRP